MPRIPGAANVPEVGTPSPPNISYPDTFAANLKSALSIYETGSDIATAIEKKALEQQKRLDATYTSKAEDDLLQFHGQEFEKAQMADNTADPKWASSYTQRIAERAQQNLAGLNEEVSPAARAEVAQKLQHHVIQFSNQAYKVQLDSQKDVANGVLKDSFDTFGAQAISNPEAVDAILINASRRLEQYRGAIPIKDEVKWRDEGKSLIIQGAVQGFFNRTNDRLAAAEAVLNGDIRSIAGDRMQELWDTLSKKDRDALATKVVQAQSQLSTARQAERAEQDRRGKLAADAEVKRLILDPEVTPDDRAAGVSRMRTNPYVSPDTAKALDKFVREGGKEDIEAHVFAAEREIRNGRIRTDDQLIEAMGRDRWQLSIETLRKRLVPMIETHQEKTFTDVLEWGRAQLGINKESGIAARLSPSTVDKDKLLEAQLRDYRQRDKGGDLWSFGRKAVEDVQKTVVSTAERSIPSLAAQYRRAVQQKDRSAISLAHQALTSTLVEAGWATPGEAARSDFDPLAVIDKPRTK